MVVISSELEAVKTIALQRFKDSIVGMKVGDDDTTPDESDTDIGNQIAEASLQGTDESVAGQITYTTKYGITSYVGDTIKEVVLKDVSGNIKTRDLTVQDEKGADEIHWVDCTVKVVTKNKS